MPIFGALWLIFHYDVSWLVQMCVYILSLTQILLSRTGRLLQQEVQDMLLVQANSYRAWSIVAESRRSYMVFLQLQIKCVIKDFSVKSSQVNFLLLQPEYRANRKERQRTLSIHVLDLSPSLSYSSNFLLFCSSPYLTRPFSSTLSQLVSAETSSVWRRKPS